MHVRRVRYRTESPINLVNQPAVAVLRDIYRVSAAFRRNLSAFSKPRVRRSLRTVFILEQISSNYNTQLHVKYQMYF